MGKPKPAPLRERDITRQIAREYYKEFDQLIESDVIIVGAGLAGMSSSVMGIVGWRALWGLGNALFIATALATIVNSAKGSVAQAVILYEAALGLGIAVGPLVGGPGHAAESAHDLGIVDARSKSDVCWHVYTSPRASAYLRLRIFPPDITPRERSIWRASWLLSLPARRSRPQCGLWARSACA